MSAYSLKDIFGLLTGYESIDISSKISRWIKGKYVRRFKRIKLKDNPYNTLRFALLDFVVIYKQLSIAFLLPLKEIYKDVVDIKINTISIDSEAEQLKEFYHYYTLKFRIPHMDSDLRFDHFEFRWSDKEHEIDILGPAPVKFTVTANSKDQKFEYLEYCVNELFYLLMEDFWFFDKNKDINKEAVYINSISVSDFHFNREYIDSKETFNIDMDKKTNIHIRDVFFANLVPCNGCVRLEKNGEFIYYKFTFDLLVEFMNFYPEEFKKFNVCHPTVIKFILNSRDEILRRVRSNIDSFTHWLIKNEHINEENG